LLLGTAAREKAGPGFDVEMVLVIGVIIGRDDHSKSGMQFQAASQLTEEAPSLGDRLTDAGFQGIVAFAQTAPKSHTAFEILTDVVRTERAPNDVNVDREPIGVPGWLPRPAARSVVEGRGEREVSNPEFLENVARVGEGGGEDAVHQGRASPAWNQGDTPDGTGDLYGRAHSPFRRDALVTHPLSRQFRQARQVSIARCPSCSPWDAAGLIVATGNRPEASHGE
jgi:hypothetical protein